MSYWNRRHDVSQAQWMLYGLLEMATGAIAMAFVASSIRKKAVDKAFEGGRICGKLESATDFVKKFVEAKKKEETAE